MPKSGQVNRVLYFSLLLAFAVLLFSRVLLPVHAASDQLKIGFVDMQKVINTHLKSTPEFREMEELYKQKQAELNRMGEELKKIEDELEKGTSGLTEEEKTSRKLELDKKKVDYEMFLKKGNMELQVKGKNLEKDVLNDIEKVINSLAEREGFSIIITKQYLLFGASSFDLTDKILVELAKP